MNKVIEEDGTEYTNTKDVLRSQKVFIEIYIMKIILQVTGQLKLFLGKITENYPAT